MEQERSVFSLKVSAINQFRKIISTIFQTVLDLLTLPVLNFQCPVLTIEHMNFLTFFASKMLSRP